MRPKRQPSVFLVVPKSGIKKAFEISHAERLLDMGLELNGGWELPEDSEYEYTEEYGLKLKSNK